MAKRPKKYAKMRLRDLCGQMHAFYKAANTSDLQRRQFRPEHLPTKVMRPQEAVQKLTRNQVRYLPLDEMYGKIATTLFVVYPPGIATIAPGEVLDDRAKPMLEYLKTSSAAPTCFPASKRKSRACTARSTKTG